jgi:alpha-beta hydrolase superfamily lysophospholipase
MPPASTWKYPLSILRIVLEPDADVVSWSPARVTIINHCPPVDGLIDNLVKALTTGRIVKHETGVLNATGGLALHYQSWHPDGPSRATIAIVHGYGEHGGRYGTYIDHLVPRGYTVYAFDLRGHGRSPGPRGHITSWDDFRSDVRSFLCFVRKREPDRPLFLLGHSMGGLIVLDFALHHPEGLAGIIASAPALDETAISPALMLLARVLSRLYPSFSIESRLNGAALSRDPEALAAYRSDPLIHARGSARLAVEMSRTMAWTREHARDWRLPLLILHGTDDRIVPFDASRAFFDRVPVDDKEFVAYAGGYHEPHHDIDAVRVMMDVERWLDRHAERMR